MIKFMSPKMTAGRRLAAGLCLLAVLGSGSSLSADAAAQKPKMMEHLQLLGYTVEDRGEALLAKHAQMLNIMIKPTNRGYFVRAFWIGKKGKEYGIEFLKFSNLLNKEAEFNRYYIDDDGDLIGEAGSSVLYERTSFGAFLTAFNSDFIEAVKRHPEMLKEHIK